MDELDSIQVSDLKHYRTGTTLEKIIHDIIVRHLKDMVFIMKVEDQRFRYIFANESGIKKAGIPRTAIGKFLDEVMPADKALLLQQEYKNLLQTGKISTFSDKIILSDGMIIYGESILTPVRNKDGVIEYVVAVTRDVTETIIEKNRLAESEQHYRSIVENNLDAIFSLNLNGVILAANPAARLLLGYPESQVNMKSINDFISDQDYDDFQELFKKSLAGSSLESLDIHFKNAQGSMLTVHIKTVPIVIFKEIKGIYVIMRDVSEQAKQAETLKFMAFHDQLTGLLNRRALIEDLEKGIVNAKKDESQLALLTIDLDRFKYINDTLGHLIGDEILKKVADRLIEIHPNQHVYRQGGDEFMLVLHNTSRQEVTRFAEKILTIFTQSFYFNSGEYYISPSIGISMYPFDGDSSQSLIKNADEALYRVKDRGKGHFQFYRSDMNSGVSQIVSIEAYLRKAIEREELSLYYQPQIELSTMKVKSFEALIRWNSAELGFILPNQFIPLAEEIGLIIPIGNWVIDAACKQIRLWNNKGHADIRIAINISPKQLQQSSIVNMIKSKIEKYQINPASLEIEITEGAMQDKKEIIPLLKSLKEIGLTISVDDFGTGFSSLSYLKQFPIDVLKIDQSFIRDILLDEKDAAITSTIIHLGRSLGLEVIAEGVESQDQVEFLLNNNCHKAQGYLFARPIKAEEIEKLFL